MEGLTSGKGNTSKQTLTIKNNTNAKDSVCTISAIDAYSISFTGSNATYAAPQGGTIGYGGTRIITLTPSTGYWLSNISCTNGYTATGNMGPNKPGSSAQDITVNNNNNAADTKCTVTMSNSYSIYMFGENVTFSKQALSVVYKGSTSVTITPSTGYYLKSFTCEDGITHNATTGESATKAQTITLTNNVLSTASCTAEAEMKIGTQWIYTYDKANEGSKQFIVPATGNYRLEVTSGRGGKPGQRQWVEATTGNYQCAVAYTKNDYFKAAYYPGSTSGEFIFNQGQILYVVPGGEGGSGLLATSDATASGCGSATKGSAGYNGGVAGSTAGASGTGGITHIALVDGLYNDIKGTDNLLLAAKSGASYKFNGDKAAPTYVAAGTGENYVNTLSSYYSGGITTIDSTKENLSTAIITYLGP